MVRRWSRVTPAAVMAVLTSTTICPWRLTTAPSTMTVRTSPGWAAVRIACRGLDDWCERWGVRGDGDQVGAFPGGEAAGAVGDTGDVGTVDGGHAEQIGGGDLDASGEVVVEPTQHLVLGVSGAQLGEHVGGDGDFAVAADAGAHAGDEEPSGGAGAETVHGHFDYG